MTLAELSAGQSAYIKDLTLSGALRQRLLDLGFVPKEKITFVKTAPMGDPILFTIRRETICIRRDTAKNITVERI